MSKFVIIIALICYMSPGTQTIRKFNDEYPNITVCESTLRTDSAIYYMPYSYQYLKAQFNEIHKCTHIEGHLIIRHIWEDGTKLDFSFLKDIEEVSGMVKIRNNSINVVILPKLKIIRGEDSMSISWKDQQEYKVSLYLQSNDLANSDHLILPSLRVISKHSVYFSSRYSLKYLPYSIRWKEFFENENNQTILTLQNPKDFYQCNSTCELRRENSTQAYCWSPLLSHCQPKTNCISLKGINSKWCFFRKHQNTTRESHCNENCVGGCYGIKNSNCQVCKDYINGESCVKDCPREYINNMGQTVRNPDFKLRVGMICATTCPDNLLRQIDACIYKCTYPEFYRVNQTCVPCSNKDGCHPKDEEDSWFYGEHKCRIEDSCQKEYTMSFYMNKTILERLTNCKHVIGRLKFSDKSFNPLYGGITVPLLYKHLKNVKKITGDFSLDGSNKVIHNLTFLQNLEEIRHLKLKDCTRNAYSTMSIFYTDLEFLGLRRLRHIYGNFFETSNNKLCYFESLPWKEYIIKSGVFISESFKCNKTCDSQCGNQGCWGPSNSMCYICQNVRAGYNCVTKCEDEPGYYTNNHSLPQNLLNSISYDDGTCKKCNILCKKNCSGPSAKECINGCKYYMENNACVFNCSKGYYSNKNECLPCDRNCLMAESTCTGGGRHLGKGGCNICHDFQLKNNSQIYCYEKCPKAFYPTSLRMCKPCTEPCSECVGKSLLKPDCLKCKAFWRDDVCVKICLGERSRQNSSNIPANECQMCHEQCSGCNFPNNATECLQCRKKKMYINIKLNQFTCVEFCPEGHNFSYKLSNTCLTKKLRQDLIDKEHQQMILNVFYWVFGLTLVIVIPAVIIVFQVYRKSKKSYLSKHLKAIYSNIHEPDSKILLFNKESILAQPNMNRLMLISTNNIIFDINGKPLGTGAFGSVYKGILKLPTEHYITKERNELDVAIKVINVLNQRAMEELLEEAKIMASVSHRHCLRLIGVCLLKKQPCLVTSFMKLGSLDKYLKKHKNSLSSYTLLSWAEQIANGMTYLEIRGIIHRDLAARNVLLNDNNLLQITDFGLSRILQGTEDNNEIIVKSGQVPIRWLAPETLDSGVYSHKTDVWAYGITLWEIFTFGQKPYEGMQVNEIQEYLSQNNRLPQPEICSLETYIEMLNCWKIPQYRSSFQELMLNFSTFCEHSTYYLNIPNDTCLINDMWSQHRHNSDYSDSHYDDSNLQWKCIYKGQPSIDGTVITCVDDYTDTESNSKVRRQSSNLSYLSGIGVFPDNREIISPLLFQSLKLSETTEENDDYLERKKETSEEHEYLEPMIKSVK